MYGICWESIWNKVRFITKLAALNAQYLPNITAYLHEDEKGRPAMIVVPGGGYAFVSPTEGEIVAKRFYEAGHQSFNWLMLFFVKHMRK